MFLLQAASPTSSRQSFTGNFLKNIKQIFTVPQLTEEQRWSLYYDYSAVTGKTSER